MHTTTHNDAPDVTEVRDVTDVRDVADVADLRCSRRALRAERMRVEHWRRLVRARIDLAVASAALPDLLGDDPDGALPADLDRDLPDQLELTGAVLGGRAQRELDLLEDLRDLDRRLARYESTVSAALGGATEEFIRRLSQDPAASLRGARETAERPMGHTVSQT